MSPNSGNFSSDISCDIAGPGTPVRGPRAGGALNPDRKMKILIFVLIFVAYLLLMRYVLPRLGVPT